MSKICAQDMLLKICRFGPDGASPPNPSLTCLFIPSSRLPKFTQVAWKARALPHQLLPRVCLQTQFAVTKPAPQLFGLDPRKISPTTHLRHAFHSLLHITFTPSNVCAFSRKNFFAIACSRFSLQIPNRNRPDAIDPHQGKLHHSPDIATNPQC